MTSESTSKKRTSSRKKYWALLGALATLAGTAAVEPTAVVTAIQSVVTTISDVCSK